jgi:hypothetical protein
MPVKPHKGQKAEQSVPLWKCVRLTELRSGQAARVRAATWYQARQLGMVVLGCGPAEIAVAPDEGA